MTKSGREIMEILEAFDLTGCAHSPAQLARADRKTVLRYVALREAGHDPAGRQRRVWAVDEFAAKVAELVDGSRRQEPGSQIIWLSPARALGRPQRLDNHRLLTLGSAYRFA